MSQRDDRILLSTQWVALVVVLVLLPALVIAYVIGLGLGAVALAALYAAMERSGSSRA